MSCKANVLGLKVLTLVSLQGQGFELQGQGLLPQGLDLGLSARSRL